MKIMRVLLFCLMLLVLSVTSALAECHHTYDMVDVKKVTCESDGYYLLKCNDCGHTVKEITDKAYGHDWAYVTGQEADCTEDGFKRYMCGNCGETRIETVNAPGHKWKDSHVLEEATCTKAGSMRTVCEVCGLSSTRKIEKSHKYGEWTITEEATDHSKGTRTRTCRLCKKKQTEAYYPEGTLYKDIKGHSDEVKDLQQKLTDLGYLNDKGDGVRFGNGIEFWGAAEDIKVENNRIWECWDAALTSQSSEMKSVQRNIEWRGNQVWNCEYSFEFWQQGKDAFTENVIVEKNTFRNAGKGWGHKARWNPNAAHLMLYDTTTPTVNFVVRDHVFDCSENCIMRLFNDWSGSLKMDGNTWISKGEPLCRYHGRPKNDLTYLYPDRLDKINDDNQKEIEAQSSGATVFEASENGMKSMSSRFGFNQQTFKRSK